jgi:hypothetical protein
VSAPAIGPFETAAEAMAHPAVRAIYEAMHTSLRRGVGEAENLRLLQETCETAGVTLGSYDRRILQWLAGWEAQVFVVIAGFITRAAGHGLTTERLAAVLDALDVATDELRDRAANCGDCDADPAELCGTCENRLARAEGWDKVAETLRGQR